MYFGFSMINTDGTFMIRIKKQLRGKRYTNTYLKKKKCHFYEVWILYTHKVKTQDALVLILPKNHKMAFSVLTKPVEQRRLRFRGFAREVILGSMKYLYSS